jgi:N-methylhydantoinase A/oxoprolinase/acetone carboxylase beta subunit
MATTVATNALLERKGEHFPDSFFFSHSFCSIKGERFGLVVTQGFKVSHYVNASIHLIQ